MTQPVSTTHPSPTEQIFGNIDPLEVLKRCGRTFYAASLTLPRGVRTDLALLYALCRAIDDCADSSEDNAARSPAVQPPSALLDVVESGLRGEHTRSPVINSFLPLAQRHNIPLALAHQLIEGVKVDLGRVRIKTLDELLQYSYRVASTVGLMMCRILNVPDEGDSFAVDLGIAMQLTNIARDVTEDARAGRVYLPAEWVPADRVLDHARPDGIPSAATTTDPLNGDDNADLARAITRLVDTAEVYYQSAELGMQFLPLSVRGGIRAAAWNYRAIGTIVRRDPARSLRERSRTTATGKLLRTAAALWASSLESLPLGPADPHDATLHGAVRSLRAIAT
ncbi:MAG: phytoene/squalene synthase family protein [Planctomycetota bacterium]